jgi:ATP-dependent Lhr-like helicase
MVIHHMLETDILAEDAGIIGLGRLGEREFGRRHFNDLVAAFTSPWLLDVYHGVMHLGGVHPTSLARRSGEAALALLLGGRSWRVTDIDWARRRVAVVPTDHPGNARWLGMTRMLSFLVCRAEERIVTGTQPSCEVSRRASKQLDTLREELQFIDGHSLPLVSNGVDRVTAWLFAGGLVSASIARELSGLGLPVVEWNDVYVVVRVHDPERVGQALENIEVTSARPALPNDLSTALKFGLCLPPELVEAVLIARTARPKEVEISLSRKQRQILGFKGVSTDVQLSGKVLRRSRDADFR